MNMLIKGNERRVVIVKGKKGSPYEMACIFLKENTASKRGDIVKDAEEIICNAQTERIMLKRKRKGRFSKIILFLLGLIAGILLSISVYLIFSVSY